MVHYRRRLPHWHPDHATFFVTWRLHGSWPRMQIPYGLRLTAGQRFVLADRAWDRATGGPHWLAQPRIADALAEVILASHDTGHCRLWAWCIMANHCHALVEPAVPLPKLMAWWKSQSAAQANEILGRQGQSFWLDESYDRWMRSPLEAMRTANYIEYNPVKAGLVERPEDWRWSSAWQGQQRVDGIRASA